MAVRSLNKVMLIGNLTRDPNQRFTPNNTAVCSFGLATNRTVMTGDGNKDERVDFHNIVAWGKLAEICGQLLHKGDKVFVEGRLQTRDWKTADGADRRITEIVIEQMMLLNSPSGNRAQSSDYESYESDYADSSSRTKASNETQSSDEVSDQVEDVEDVADDIPF